MPTPRETLADALLAAGPDAPTLCEGWRTRHLAAHIVLRERRPWTMAGASGGPLADWTERQVQTTGDDAALPDAYAELVGRVAAGPGAILTRLTDGGNVLEFLVHAEDVLRGERVPDAPRLLDDELESRLFRSVSRFGRFTYRRRGVGVIMRVPDGPRAVVVRGAESVVLTGTPVELALHATGRERAALVDVDGPADAVARFTSPADA
ncbi:conserved hypothetical protein [Beutenbergia cavernae DSM 12333]|uniref:Mycothiol-dependent maleylpyruvate isomerase metal-binding domain-containing protein n=1 Tax=Beutenbergia cavernae (strain ATCC BAA-8 / DSM 12333 / CCUG 43141 / JCM 11478 / NBRC 16432 / NCIMB 13614 / HKI 0122) TaxID=471853 RepID=C5BV93_BEUC1|nr:TIGR03085 family metal-binding protein [Beutenbergia cavernae]ACQ80480.1 conserved hypothetical protein [Beutenbergia cavernae DSM 12333]